MKIFMLRNFTNRYGNVIYRTGINYDLPDGYAEFLIKNRYAAKYTEEGVN